MGSLFTQVFQSVVQGNVTPPPLKSPLINEVMTSFSTFLASTNQLRKKKFFMSWFRTQPELTGFVNKVARDVTHKWHFTPFKPDDTNRNKIMRAERFANEIVLLQTMEAQMADMLVTGDGFGWLGKIKQTDLKKKLKEVLKREIFIESKEKDRMEHMLLAEFKRESMSADQSFVDEDVLRPRKYRYVASSTMEVVFDQFDVRGYNQIVARQLPIPFTPEEIVHYTLMRRDGKVNGFTPVESLMVQLELLRSMWQNMLSIYKNGGAPDKLFVLENTQINSPQYKRIEEQIQKYKLVENKHGNMLFTGKVTVEDLQQMDQMQFKDSGLYITGLMALQWGIPRSSIPFIIGDTNTKDDTGGNSEKGYWTVIKDFQDTFAQTMNTQLWIPYFGVKIEFENAYINADIQGQTALQLRVNNIMAEDSIWKTKGKQLSTNRVMRMLGRVDKDLIDFKVEDDPIMASQNTMNQQLSKDEVNDSDDKKNANAKKKDEQTATIASNGKKPSGRGKERLMFKKLSEDARLEYKQFSLQMPTDVKMPTFIRLYNEDKAYNPGMPPRLFVSENPEFTSFTFKSTDFVYRVVLPTGQISTDNVDLMNFDPRFIYSI